MTGLNLSLNGKALAVVQSYKYLGVLLNPSLTLDAHAQNIIGHVASKINELSYLRVFVTSGIALTIYKSTIVPLLEYSNIIFSLISAKQRKKMQRLQNRALSDIYRQLEIIRLFIFVQNWHPWHNGLKDNLRA